MPGKLLIVLYTLLLILTASCGIFTPEALTDDLIKSQYQPFAEDSRAVKLPGTSALRLTDDLPRLDGATALYPLYAAFVQAVYPEGEYNYQPVFFRGPDDTYQAIKPVAACSATGYAYQSLIGGDVDIIFCARPSDEQLRDAAEKGIKLNMVPIGKEAFVFFVNKRNAVSELATDQIRGIYSGSILNWKKVGGGNSEIRAYQRTKNSGSQTMLETIMGETAIKKPLTENVLTFMMDIIELTSAYRNYKNAIGYSFLFYKTQMVKNNKIKLLSINGVYPSAETIQDGSYPFTDYLYAITAKTENPNVSRFIEWMLSEEGQYLVKETGYIPLE